MFSHGPMSGPGGQRSCLVHILIRERCKIGTRGAMAPVAPPGSPTE